MPHGVGGRAGRCVSHPHVTCRAGVCAGEPCARVRGRKRGAAPAVRGVEPVAVGRESSAEMVLFEV